METQPSSETTGIAARYDIIPRKPPWRPRVVGVVSLCFGPLSGAIITSINLRRLIEPQKAFRLLTWTIPVSFVIAAALIRMPEALARMFGFGLDAVCAAFFPTITRDVFNRWKTSNPNNEEASTWIGIAWGLLGLVLLGLMTITIFILQGMLLNHFNLKAEGLRSQKLYGDAERDYRLASAIDPNDAVAHFGLGECLADEQKWDASVSEHRAALVLMPQLAEGHFELGSVLTTKGDLDDAITEFREAVRLKPDYAFAHNALGWALLRKGDNSGSMELVEAGRLDPRISDANNKILEGAIKTGNPQSPGQKK